MMGGVHVYATLHEKPGHAPVRRMVEVPVAQVPGVNAILLRLGAEVANLRDAVINTPDPQYLADLVVDYEAATARITELESELREEREWKTKNVLRRLWVAISKRTTQGRLTGGGVSGRNAPKRSGTAP